MIEEVALEVSNNRLVINTKLFQDPRFNMLEAQPDLLSKIVLVSTVLPPSTALDEVELAMKTPKNF